MLNCDGEICLICDDFQFIRKVLPLPCGRSSSITTATGS